VTTPFRYRSPEEDSARWLGFPYRDGDIVISTRSKTGTTWVQMICALLIFQTPDLPAPLAQLSPWLDHLITPRDQVYAQLAAQPHRRFIKTHTPLDGIPLDPRASYIVTARHPEGPSTTRPSAGSPAPPTPASIPTNSPASCGTSPTPGPAATTPTSSWSTTTTCPPT
jgi:hypothetical protein